MLAAVLTQKRATLSLMLGLDCRGARKKQGERGGGCCSYQVRGSGGKGQAGGSRAGECWSDSGFILKAGSVGLPDGLEEKCERERRQGTSQVSAGREGASICPAERLCVGQIWEGRKIRNGVWDTVS